MLLETLFSTFLSLKWVFSFTFCSSLQMYLEIANIERKKANIITCILFQIYFVVKAFYLIYIELFGILEFNEIRLLTLQNMHDIYGYFIFDLVYMFIYNRNILFILHHFIGLYILNTVELLGINETWYHNLICFLAEVTNPPLNSLQLTIGYPELRTLNKRIILYTYFAFRIVLFPIFSIRFLIVNISPYNNILFTCFMIIYTMSVIWFYKILQMNSYFLQKK